MIKAAVALVMLVLLPISSFAAHHPIHWNAPKQCLYYSLTEVLYEVSAISPVVVTSTCRNEAHNRKVGGAKKSYHLRGRAVDFRVRPNKSQEVKQALLADPRVGGWKQYRPGSFHIDSGSRRTWNTKVKMTKYAKKHYPTLKLSSHSLPLTGYSDTATGN